MVYIILLMSLPLLGWTVVGIIPNKYLNRIIDGKKEASENPEKKEIPKDHWAQIAESQKK